jgi:hypothetical protein
MSLAFALTLALEAWSHPVETTTCPPSSYSHWGKPDADGRVPALPVDTSHFPRFFPADAIDPFQCVWFSEQLHALNETSLALPDTGQILRFTWLRTFHRPMVFTVLLPEAPFTSATLTWKSTDGLGGYQPGRLVSETSISLGGEETEALRERVERAQICAANPDLPAGLDGSNWIFENSTNQAYCLQVRWSPGEGPFNDLGSTLMNLAAVPDQDRY